MKIGTVRHSTDKHTVFEILGEYQVNVGDPVCLRPSGEVRYITFVDWPVVECRPGFSNEAVKTAGWLQDVKSKSLRYERLTR